MRMIDEPASVGQEPVLGKLFWFWLLLLFSLLGLLMPLAFLLMLIIIGDLLWRWLVWPRVASFPIHRNF